METDIRSNPEIREQDNTSSIPITADTPVKRGRGRPRTKNLENSQTFQVEDAKVTKKEKKDKEVKEQTKTLIETFESLSSVMMGTDTKFTEGELKLISPSLENVVRNFDSSSLDRVNKFTAPIMLVLGLTMWGMRVLPESKINVKNSNSNDATSDTPKDKEQPSAIFDFANTT